eukprot:13323998-Heterocapsa_arctica.AAC.1
MSSRIPTTKQLRRQSQFQAPVADLPSQDSKKKKGKLNNAPLSKDVKTDDPHWEVIGDRVTRRYKGTNRPP